LELFDVTRRLVYKRVAPDVEHGDRRASSFATDTPVEVDYYNHGGILHFVLRQLIKELMLSIHST
jgi:aconitase A